MFLLPHQHSWGPTERIDQTLGLSWWHWCKCTVCGAPGFKILKDDGTISQVTRCWQECDIVYVK